MWMGVLTYFPLSMMVVFMLAGLYTARRLRVKWIGWLLRLFLLASTLYIGSGYIAYQGTTLQDMPKRMLEEKEKNSQQNHVSEEAIQSISQLGEDVFPVSGKALQEREKRLASVTPERLQEAKEKITLIQEPYEKEKAQKVLDRVEKWLSDQRHWQDRVDSYRDSKK
ncbi:hypothetical protein EP56_01825 [Listeriaceae bacterium FSL A5-0209]|nr:hypothetical protein EP56_01825 [Listeriaceae bacterium FSL A5-0209]